MPIASYPRTDALTRHLRQAAFAVALLVVTLTAGLHFSGNSPFRHLFGDDLVPSYMAGTFVRHGRPEKLLDYNAAEQFQAKLRRAEGLEQHGRTGPWLNPPFYALLFAPLSALPYRPALWGWFALNLSMLSASIFLLYRMLPADRRRLRDGVTLATLLCFSMPAIQAMACQQNTFLSLLILSTTVTLARANCRMLAGAAVALFLFKPQLAVIACGATACLLGWPAVVGMAVTAVVLVGGGELLMPGSLADYFHKLPALLPYLRIDRPYAWERQMTWLGFWRLLTGGRTGGPNATSVMLLWSGSAAAAGITIATCFWRSAAYRALVPHMKGDVLLPLPVLRERGGARASPGGTSGQTWVPGASHPTLLALTIVAAPLLMPYYMDYDLLLLAIPATLLAADRMSTGPQPLDRPLVLGWSVLYALLYVNAAVGDATHLNASLLLLTALFALSCIRLLRKARPTVAEQAAELVSEQTDLPLRCAA